VQYRAQVVWRHFFFLRKTYHILPKKKSTVRDALTEVSNFNQDPTAPPQKSTGTNKHGQCVSTPNHHPSNSVAVITVNTVSTPQT
jgi:hypothetical protein